MRCNGCGVTNNTQDLHDYTALHYAAMWGWASVLCLLVNANGDFNAAVNTGRTPLMLAVQFHNDLAVQYLCSIKKLHVNLSDADGNTALILCAGNGTDGNEIALTLLKAGADPNMENRKKKCPLSIACEDQNSHLVDLLMDYKVNH
jgi:ankyrin repeat protein